MKNPRKSPTSNPINTILPPVSANIPCVFFYIYCIAPAAMHSNIIRFEVMAQLLPRIKWDIQINLFLALFATTNV
jgi:hypothetical protein